MSTRRPSAPGRLRLSDLPMTDVRRGFVRVAFLVVVIALFVLMVHRVFVAAVLGAIVAIYLRPVYCWLEERTGREALAAVVTLVLLIVPVLALFIYGYLEVRAAAEYLDAHTAEVAAQIDATLDRLPFTGQVQAQDSIRELLDEAAALATSAPAGLQSALARFAVGASVFLFTAFYVLTSAETIIAYLRGKVPARYADLAESMEENVSGVLYGAVYGTLVTQTLKSLVILVLCLVFGVPLAVVLALATFVIGFFPVVGSWSVYLPVAGYLLVFQDAPWQAVGMVVGGAFVNTVVLSLFIRPKLASAKSHVLDFYWMFIGLVAGVYAFGVPGIVLGPILVGLLKAVLDTITADLPWARPEGEDDAPKAEIFAEEELRDPEPPPDDEDE